ncbi:MAG TPA: glycoside hydrolase family 2 TIM barrel-domain containing protein [Mucilaginibacter sp.]|nr:glycoside hydrolase family 2 TIM barrel-domain containing protein [Mucilaginibacter sp.]
MEIRVLTKRSLVKIAVTALLLIGNNSFSQGVKFNHDFSPAEGIIKPQEQPYREEICLNGKWDFQPVAIPANWVANQGIAPELTAPQDGKWEDTKIKIPSPWNVNSWGGGSNVGKGTNQPYSPSSVYYPSYPKSWEGVRMGWLKRQFNVPVQWTGKRILVHFEAVMGDFVVMVNGHKAAGHFGDYLPFDVDVTDFVKSNQSNELLVGVRHRNLFNKTDAKYRYFRSTYPPGSNTDGLVGIWQDVFLVAVPPVRVTNIFAKPWVNKDMLEFDVQLVNQTKKVQDISLTGNIKEWINQAGKDVISAPEIKWTLGKNSLVKVNAPFVTLQPGETKKITLSTRVNNRLKYWTPATPNLYTLVLNVNNGTKIIDTKTERFGWRQFIIHGKDFYLNGSKIQCFADIQHPFGAYVESRRFAYAWFKMIKDFGGNAVRLHAQPWPSTYLGLADEMGLMVLDEAALFGSSLSLNFGEEISWERTAKHIDDLVMRDRNHPAVVGWSAGNELFAISAYNKPTPEIAAVWEEKSVALARRPALLDPTRDFITDDGDEDMHGKLAVWSKHFSHGITLERLPKVVTKPLIVGESGATYYGKPAQLVQFAGDKPYESYYGRNEALAVDVYQNVIQMAKPLLAYYSPSEVSWFGIEHMNLGYSDYSRLPDEHDGIFAGKPYEEGKPGYQMERIPPYVTTFNPGLDPSLPLYKPLPMFEALKAAMAGKPSKWDHILDTARQQKFIAPEAKFSRAILIGKSDGQLAKFFDAIGLNLNGNKETASLVIVDGDNVTAGELEQSKGIIDRVKKNGGLVWVLLSGRSEPSKAVNTMLPSPLQLGDFKTTDLQGNMADATGKLFNIRDLYFSEMNGDKYIMKQAIEGDLLKHGSTVLEAGKIDWSLLLNYGENRKCAQAVLYEHLIKPKNAALLNLPFGKAGLGISTIDYTLLNNTTSIFWKKLCESMAIRLADKAAINDNTKKQHDLLMDGPMN